jgi:hypothetical protein
MRTARLGAYSGDPGSIGARLCIMPYTNFYEKALFVKPADVAAAVW